MFRINYLGFWPQSVIPSRTSCPRPQVSLQVLLQMQQRRPTRATRAGVALELSSSYNGVSVSVQICQISSIITFPPPESLLRFEVIKPRVRSMTLRIRSTMWKNRQIILKTILHSLSFQVTSRERIKLNQCSPRLIQGRLIGVRLIYAVDCDWGTDCI